MRVLPRFLWIAVTLIAFALSSAALAAPPAMRPGEIIIQFKNGVPASDRQAILADLGATDVEDLRPIGAQHARLRHLTVDEAIARYRGNPKIAFIEPNYIYQAMVVPNDPRFPEMWPLSNSGQSGGTPGADIKAPQAWDVTTGSSSVLVAIVDTGIDWTHPDLAGNVFTNPNEIPGNGIDDDANGFVDDVRGWDFVNYDNNPMDDHGHGTHVSGTVAAIGNNGLGTVGVSWSARILPLKFLDAGGFGNTVAAINAIDYATRMGARVINASWGGGEYSEALRLSIQHAVDGGAVFVAAAGNSGMNTDLSPTYPADYDLAGILSVAASDARDSLATFSNYGATSVDLAAPGVNVLSTLPGGYGFASGTSMAAPHVSGVLALLFARFPGLGPLEAKNLVMTRVDPIPSLAGRMVSGGRLNALFAVSDPDVTPPGVISDLVASDIQGTHVTLRWTATGDDGAVGRASRYDVRYSFGPITSGNWVLATPVPGAPAPSISGSPEQFVVGDLAFHTKYYFALKALDEFGNPSPLSNVANATTLQPPVIAVAPPSLEADLLTGQRTTRTLTISNQGASELHFSIGSQAGLPGGAAIANSPAGPVEQPMSMLATAPALVAPPAGATPWPAPATTGATPSPLADQAPQGYPRSPTAYAAAAAPGRSALEPSQIRIANIAAGSLRVLILYSGGDVSEIHGLLAAFPDIGAVDVMDAQSGVPALSQLTGYQAVLVVDNNPFIDPVGIGNVLADYVDAGGGLVMTLATFINGWNVQGRLANEGYLPFNIGSGPGPSSTLGAFDPNHPIMAGVQSVSGSLLGVVSVAAGAVPIALWADGNAFVATKGHVAAVNIFVGATGYWSGDVPLLLHNAALWSAPATWLSVDPVSGVVPAGGQVDVQVSLDASGLDGGLYAATLMVGSDDPNTPEWTVPVTLQVTGVPDIAIAGELVTLESVQDYATDGATTQHRFDIAVAPSGAGTLELVAFGDYGDLSETATLIAEGTTFGSVGGVGVDCSTAQGHFTVSPGALAALTADGVVQAQVRNSSAVNVFCAPNRHTVRLSYRGPSDALDFGEVFLTAHRELGIEIRNDGTAALDVSGLEIQGADFSVAGGGFVLAPRESRRVVVSFAPTAAQAYVGTLVIHSDDPDEAAASVPLRGVGQVPPDVAWSPVEFHETLPTGGRETRVITLTNQGGSELIYAVSVGGSGATIQTGPSSTETHSPAGSSPLVPTGGAPLAGLAPAGPSVLSGTPLSVSSVAAGEMPASNATPSGYVPRVAQPSVMSGANVLLVQDTAPWGTAVNEQLLIADGISFDVITTSALAATNLLRYRKVIVASDQPTAAYQRLAAQMSQIDDYVQDGGVLEFHAAGWGFANGDVSLVTLPGGMRIAQRFSGFNYVWNASHPLMAGVPSLISGTAASHAFFYLVPGDATWLTVDLDYQPTMVVYPRGRGTVIVGSLTFEFSVIASRDPGIVLRNLIPYGFDNSAGWLAASPLAGRIPPGGSAEVVLGLDAAGLLGGDYHADVRVRSNDPDTPEAVVPVALHVEAAPDIAVTQAPLTVDSAALYFNDGATTTHALPFAQPPLGEGQLRLEADGEYGGFFEAATLIVEGTTFGDVGRIGVECVQASREFPISARALEAFAADGVLSAEVRNTPDVGIGCALNRHRLILTYTPIADSLDFDQVFTGSCGTRSFLLSNLGTDVLHVASLSVTGTDFHVTPAGPLTVAPGDRVEVTVEWCPGAPGPMADRLEVGSDDPDHPVLAVQLVGRSLIPPAIAVDPTSLHEDLFTGQVKTRTLTVRNDGGSDLDFTLELESAPLGNLVAHAPAATTAAAGRGALPATIASGATAATSAASGGPGATEYGAVQSNGAPAGYRPLESKTVRAAGATVLLIQENAPWGTASNEQVLAANHLVYDVLPASAIGAISLASYDRVIIPSDQTSTYYQTLAGFASALDAYVRSGGILEVHAAGWGWMGGDASLLPIPGGLRTIYGPASLNNVLMPDHPILAGVPSPFTGNSASHGYFTGIPSNADRLVADESGQVNLVVYALGRGLVIASVQTLEFAYAYGWSFAPILSNMIPFEAHPRPKWLSAEPTQGRVPAGGSMQIALRFDATGLGTSDLAGNVVLASNDPRAPETRVPVSLHVTGVPDIALLGQLVDLESTRAYHRDGDQTLHDLPITTPPQGDGTIVLDVNGDYGDFVESASLILEGTPLGEVGRTGLDCSTGSGTFSVSAADLARVTADGVVHIVVQNTPDVNVFCAVNEHHVRLSYHGAADRLDFGPVFIGQCRALALEVRNDGTEVLNVSAPTVADASFQVSPATDFSLAPDSSVALVVSFCPTQPGARASELVVRSDDPDEPEFRLPVAGEGVIPPDIAVAPPAIAEALLPGGAVDHALAIANGGGLPLHFRVEIHSDSSVGAPVAAAAAARVATAMTPEAVAAARARYGEGPGEVSTPAPPPATLARLGQVAAPRMLAPAQSANAVLVFADDMESGVGGWVHYPTMPGGDQWVLSVGRASSGTHSWHVSQHPIIGGDALQTPVLDLTALTEATMTFNHWYNFDDCGGTLDFEPDGGVVEVSEVGTNQWVQITPASGYPYVLDNTCGNPLANRPAYSHDVLSPAFESASFDLTPFAGRRIAVRFYAGWDCGNCEPNEGWYIDDVRVFSNQARWVSTSPTEGVVPPGGVADLNVHFDASGLDPGEYRARLAILSDDPDTPRLDVPLSLFVADVEATLDSDPNTINLGRRGQWLTCYIEPLPGFDPAGIDVSSLRLNGQVPADPTLHTVGDADGDGRPDLMVKFDFDAARPLLPEGDPIRVLVTGMLGGQRMFGAEDVRVIRHQVLSPTAGQTVAPGSSVPILWSLPSDWQGLSAALSTSFDGGVTWREIASGVNGTSYAWTVPNRATARAVVRVVLSDALGPLATDWSDRFSIAAGTTSADPTSAPDAPGPALANAPNPFSASGTTVAFATAAPGEVELTVFSATGRRVRVLTRGWMPAGRHQIRWDGRDERGVPLASGVYFCRLRAVGIERTRRMTLIE